MSTVGVGIITCNREDFYKSCFNSLKQCSIDELVTVNDGKPYKEDTVEHFTGTHYIQHDVNRGVGITKNDALRYLLDKDCEHIFLIEDDIVIGATDIFTRYIDAAKASGLWHLMYGYHGPANKHPQSKLPVPRMVMNYDKGIKLAFNRHCVGAFCYYHKGVLKNVGLMDETYKNAWEHVSHSLQIVEAGLLPGYWWWPDLHESYDYLYEQACSEDNSVIRWEDGERKIAKKDWQVNIEAGAQHFVQKHGYTPVGVPDTDEDEIDLRLNVIKERYSRCEV